jgi:hypothetical protein
LDWGPQLVSAAWDNPNEDAAYADCDGDGTVGAGDVLGIIQNWHARPGQSESPPVDRVATCEAILRAIDENAHAPGMASLRTAVVNYLQEEQGGPLESCLEPSRPNPFRDTATWMLTVPGPTSARLAVFDLSGKLVWRILMPSLTIGTTPIAWNGTNLQGSRVATGIYYYKLAAGGYHASGELMLVR